MGKSARVLGREFGKSAREMNLLLKEHGYLYGEPGAYGLTEKGEQFAQEDYHSRGTGGYAHYNRNWETRTWNDETAAALRADLQADPAGDVAQEPSMEHESPAEVAETFLYMPVAYLDDDDEDPPPTWGELAMTAAVVAAMVAAPHAKPFWDNRLKPTVWDKGMAPAVQKLRERFAEKQEPVNKQDSVEIADS